MIASLLVSGSAPPSPSIWRLSGEPNTRRISLSRSAPGGGMSSSRRKIALLVPPRMIVQRNASMSGPFMTPEIVGMPKIVGTQEIVGSEIVPPR